MKALKNKKLKDEDKVKTDHKIKDMEISIVNLEKTISDIGRNVKRMRSVLDAHINRQYTEIRVIEENGEWGDYSGIFYINDDEEKDVVVKKAQKHFDEYFKNGLYHQDKKLGLFLYSPRSGKRLLTLVD